MATVPSLPTVLDKVAKWLLKHEDVLVSPFLVLYDYISDQTPIESLLWRHVTVRYARATPASTVEDYAQFGFNITNITGGQLDTTWTAGDYTIVDAAIDEMLSKIVVAQSTSHSLVDVRYYQAGFNPALPIGQAVWKVGDAGDPPNRFIKMGPPVHLHIPGSTGGQTAGGVLPYQVAMSVTLKTPGPRHWGRMYIPGLAFPDLSSSFGRFSQTIQTTVANAFAEMQDDLTSQGFQLVVPTTQQDGRYATGLSGVNSIVVDDIPDVIRRRRPKQPAIKQVGVPTP